MARQRPYAKAVASRATKRQTQGLLEACNLEGGNDYRPSRLSFLLKSPPFGAPRPSHQLPGDRELQL